MTTGDDDLIARRLARLSNQEIEAAIAKAPLPAVVREAAIALTRGPSERLGIELARFDRDIGAHGLARAALSAITALGACVDTTGECPKTGAALVVTNHPGAFDALATMAALRRNDVRLVAAEREFLRAMPRLSAEHLVFLDEGQDNVSVLGRARGMRRALDWLEEGHVVVQYGAGAIEPDARFISKRDRARIDPLLPWAEGTGVFAHRAARLGAHIVPAFVSGVHSPRAKKLLVVRWAERRGITTIAPLIQATLPGFRDVVISIRFGDPIDHARLRGAKDDRDRTRIVREAVRALSSRA